MFPHARDSTCRADPEEDGREVPKRSTIAGEIREKCPAHDPESRTLLRGPPPTRTPNYRRRRVEPLRAPDATRTTPPPAANPRQRFDGGTAEGGTPGRRKGRERRAPSLSNEGQNDGAHGAPASQAAAQARPHFAPWPDRPSP